MSRFWAFERLSGGCLKFLVNIILIIGQNYRGEDGGDFAGYKTKKTAAEFSAAVSPQYKI